MAGWCELCCSLIALSHTGADFRSFRGRGLALAAGALTPQGCPGLAQQAAQCTAVAP